MDKPHVTMTLDQYDEMCDHIRCLSGEINELNQKIEMIKTIVLDSAQAQVRYGGSLYGTIEDLWVFLDMGVVETHPALQENLEWYRSHTEKEAHPNEGYQE